MIESVQNITPVHTQIKAIRKLSFLAIFIAFGISIAAIIQEGKWFMLAAIPVVLLFRKYIFWLWGDVQDVMINEEQIYLLDKQVAVEWNDVIGIDYKTGIASYLAEIRLRPPLKRIQFACSKADYDQVLIWYKQATTM